MVMATFWQVRLGPVHAQDRSLELLVPSDCCHRPSAPCVFIGHVAGRYRNNPMLATHEWMMFVRSEKLLVFGILDWGLPTTGLP